MTLFLVFSVGFITWILYDLEKKNSLGDTILSPIFYFSCLWFLAFPLHAWLLYQGWVDTQQHVVLTEKALANAVWVSLLSLLVVYAGVRTGRSFQSEPSFEFRQPNLKQGRVSLVIVVLILLAVIFLKQTVFEHGTFKPFIGNEQNESRVGSGPLFVLSELFNYGLIAATPVLLTSGQRRVLLLIFVVGVVLAFYMGIVLTSRRVIVLPLFVLTLAWLYIYRKHPRVRVVLGAALLASTVFSVPALQYMRYIATPQVRMEKSIVDDSTPQIQMERSIADYCRWIDRTPTTQKAVTILDAKGAERTISGISASVATRLCDKSSFIIYTSTQNIASSYGLFDHLATFLNKATPLELIVGVDHGIAWSYNVALALVPRAIWQDKPMHYGSVAIQKWLYPGMYDVNLVTTTLPPSFAVDFLYGFGLPSLLILCFALGRLLALAHVWLLSGPQPGNNIRFVVGLCLMAYMFNIVRSGTGIVQALIPMLAILLLIYGRDGLREFVLTKQKRYDQHP